MKHRITAILFLCLAHAALGLPKKGGRIIVGELAYPSNLLYYVGFDDYADAVNALVFDTLLERDPMTGKLLPRLASRWHFSKDHSTLTFYLDGGARFSDGVPVTSTDVKFTWKKLRDPSQKAVSFEALLANFDRCDTPGPHMVVFHSKAPAFSDLSTLGSLYILPRHFFEKGNLSTDFNRALLGSGPYRLESVEPGDRITLRRNPHYWAEGLPQNRGRYNFDEIVFRAIPNYQAQFLAFEHGDLDYYYFLSSDQWANETKTALYRQRGLRALDLATKTPPNLVGIAWNFNRPLFQDRRVRLALAYLMDRPRWEHQLFHDAYESSSGPFALASPYHAPDLKPVPFNPDKARDLLKAAGWDRIDGEGYLSRHGERFTFTVTTFEAGTTRFLALYQRDLLKIGIHMNIKVVDWATSLSILRDRDFDAIELSYSRDIVPSHLARAWGSDSAKVLGSENRSGVRDPALDRLARAIDFTYDESRRTQLLRAFDRRVAYLAPMAFQWEPTRLRVGISKRVGYDPKHTPKLATWINLFQYWWDSGIQPRPVTLFEAGQGG